MVRGSTPAAAEVTMRASGFSPNSRAFSAEVSNSAAEPSLIPLELPAVTVPPLRKIGPSLANCSRLVSNSISPAAFRR